MRARAMIDGAVFGAETVKAMGAAFDQAWARMAPTCGRQWSVVSERAESRGSYKPFRRGEKSHHARCLGLRRPGRTAGHSIQNVEKSHEMSPDVDGYLRDGGQSERETPGSLTTR